MAWPFDVAEYQTPQLSAISLGNMGSSNVLSTPTASGPQNIASLFSGTGGNAPGGAAAGGGFQSIANLFGNDGVFSRSSMFGGTNDKGITTGGWAPMALGLGQALLGGYQGQQAMKLAKDQFKEGKRQFDLNYGAQRQSINTQMEDRQRARVAANPGAYESVSDYMNRNRIS